MIANLIILFVVGALAILCSFLPLASSLPLPSEITDWIGYFHSGIEFIGWILPIDTIFFVFGLWFGILTTFYIPVLLFKLYRWGKTGHSPFD
jgi:hypothetical protein